MAFGKGLHGAIVVPMEIRMLSLEPVARRDIGAFGELEAIWPSHACAVVCVSCFFGS